MDFEFPPDSLMLRDMLRRFVQKEALPLEKKFFNTGALEPEERDRLRRAVEQMGLWGLTVPEVFGGGGLDTMTACLIEEELGRTFIPVETGEVTPLLFACTHEQVIRYLEPALAGKRRAIIAAREPVSISIDDNNRFFPSILLRIGVCPESWSTIASPEGTGYSLNGQKILAMKPGAEDFFILLARAPGGVTAFLLDIGCPGLSVSANDKVVLTLQGCHAGKDAILGEVGGAQALGKDQVPQMWIRTGARYVGVVERLIEMAVEHARDWISFGAPMATRPAIQRVLAELRVQVESVRWLTYHAAWLADQGEQVRVVAAQVRMASCEMLKQTVDRVTMIFAGSGSQIEIRRLVHNVVPDEALEVALDGSRALVAAEMLALSEDS